MKSTTHRLPRWVMPRLPHLIVTALFLVGIAGFYNTDTGFTSLLGFGEAWQGHVVPEVQQVPHVVQPGEGYDGQFYAQLAVDPLVRDQETVDAMDNPGYRARRPLLPMVAYVLGFGRPGLILNIYALLNVGCWLLLAALMLRWLPAGELRPVLAWCACLLSHGLLTSMRFAVPDGPSVLLMAIAILAIERGRSGLAVGVLGAASLARETNLLAGVVFAFDWRLATGDWRLATGDWRLATGDRAADLVERACLLLVPLVAWTAYLNLIDVPAVVSSGTRNFAPPLVGYIDRFAQAIGELQTQGWNHLTRTSLLTLIALATQAVTLAANRRWRDPWWRIGIVYAGLLSVLGPAVWEGHPGAVTRVVLPMTFAFNVLLPRSRWFWPLWILGNANLLDAVDIIGY